MAFEDKHSSDIHIFVEHCLKSRIFFFFLSTLQTALQVANTLPGSRGAKGQIYLHRTGFCFSLSSNASTTSWETLALYYMSISKTLMPQHFIIFKRRCASPSDQGCGLIFLGISFQALQTVNKLTCLQRTERRSVK